MNNHTPINERTFEFAVRITKLCSYLDKQPGTPTLREVKSQKSKVKSQKDKKLITFHSFFCSYN